MAEATELKIISLATSASMNHSHLKMQGWLAQMKYHFSTGGYFKDKEQNMKSLCVSKTYSYLYLMC